VLAAGVALSAVMIVGEFSEQVPAGRNTQIGPRHASA
jgi:hypothetical protein